MIYSENILICIGVPLLVTLFFLRGNSRRFVSTFLAGMVICLLSGYISGFFNLLSDVEIELTAVYISPVVEEWMKLLPLLFCLFVLGRKGKTLLLVAVAVGAGFATFENCCYILQAGAESLFYTLIRGLSVGVMHIACMLLMNLGLILSARYRIFSFPALIGALAVAMNFHGLYNLLVSRPGVTAYIGYIMPILVTGLLYILYRQKDIREQL